MRLLKLETPGIAHYAYLLEDGGEAAVIDPRRDVEEYVQAARSLGARITLVIETHRQEDFVMGSSHLAKRTGAKIANGKHELFGHGHHRLADGETLRLGTLKLKALHTPGHTPESMSYAVYAPQQEDAWGVFTGDALFFGTTGRTDLPGADRTRENAELLYDSIHAKVAPLGDTALVLPAHGPGSVCGSGMAPLPMSTLGAEKRYNQVFTKSRADFAEVKAAERIPRPPYFQLMERVNLEGGLAPALLPGELPLLQAPEFAREASDGLVIDVREPEGFAGGHIPDAYSIWMGGLPVFGGWIAQQKTPLYLVGDDDSTTDEAVLHLSRIGMDGARGALGGGIGSWRSSGKALERSGVITVAELEARRDDFTVLDVRDDSEFGEGHIPGAAHLYVGYIEKELEKLRLPRNNPVVVTCSVGHRAGLAVSILARSGYKDVRNLLGGMTAWRGADLPVAR